MTLLSVNHSPRLSTLPYPEQITAVIEGWARPCRRIFHFPSLAWLSPFLIGYVHFWARDISAAAHFFPGFLMLVKKA